MSDHRDWEARIIADHEKNKQFAPENGSEPKFKAGDLIIFTNDFGVSFKRKVTGLYQPDPIDSFYARGFRYTIDSDSPWYPCKESSLRPDDEEWTRLNDQRFGSF